MQKKAKGKKKQALGKGLAALIPDIDTSDSVQNDFFACDIDIIKPNKYQPRITFKEDELSELAGSIKEQGVIQPLLVRKDGDEYELVAGERRLRASKIAGLGKVPVIIKDFTDSEMLEVSIVENIQREDFNPVEEAEAYHRLITEFELTQEQVAQRVGKSRSAITNFLRLRNLPDYLRKDLSSGLIRMGHARALLGAENFEIQKTAHLAVVEKKLSVRETESLIKRLNKPESKPEKTEPVESAYKKYLSSVSVSLSKQYNTDVNVKMKGKKGKVEIAFKSNEELDRLIKALQKD